MVENNLKLNLAAGVTISTDEDAKRGFQINKGKILTISGENKNTSVIKCTADASDGTSFIKSEGNLSVENVTIDTNGYGIYAVNGNVKVENSVLKSANYPCLSTNGKYTDENTTVTLKNSTLTSTNDVAVYLPANKKVTLEGCTVEGQTGIEILAGELEVIDTTFNYSKKIDVKITEKTNGSVNAGGAIFVRAQSGYLNGGTIKVTVSGVTTFTCTAADSESVTKHVAKYCDDSSKEKITISGVTDDSIQEVTKQQ